MDALDRFNVWRKTKEAGVFANRLVIGWFAGLCFVCVPRIARDDCRAAWVVGAGCVLGVCGHKG